MVNVRAPASPGSSSASIIPRKRPQENFDYGPGSSKRRLDTDPESCRVLSREPTPGKNVHFRRNLIRGPTPSGPAGRSVSPTRPALYKRIGPENDGPSPSAQLRSEHRAAQRKTSVQKGKSPRKQNAEDDQREWHYVGLGNKDGAHKSRGQGMRNRVLFSSSKTQKLVLTGLQVQRRVANRWER